MKLTDLMESLQRVTAQFQCEGNECCAAEGARMLREIADSIPRCEQCEQIMVRRPHEGKEKFAGRRTCSKACAVRLRYGNEVERFWSRVVGDSYAECWEWVGAITSDTGYGNFRSEDKTISSHRWSYQHLRGEIPEGLHLDHLCRNRACVNPWHLEPVTQLENVRRGARSRGAQEAEQIATRLAEAMKEASNA